MRGLHKLMYGEFATEKCCEFYCSLIAISESLIKFQVIQCESMKIIEHLGNIDMTYGYIYIYALWIQTAS